MKVSVLLPTKNEPLINELIQEVHKVLGKTPHEIIVIDKSDIPPKIKDAKLIIQKTDGLGNAILEGLNKATGDVILTMDCDYSHDPKDIPKILNGIKDCDIVIGSRYVNGGKTEDNFLRKIISKISCLAASLILDLNVKDSMNNFVAARKEVYRNLKLNPLGLKINMETIYKAKKMKYRVCEVPIIFHRRRAGKSKRIGIKESIKGLIYLFQLRFGLR